MPGCSDCDCTTTRRCSQTIAMPANSLSESPLVIVTPREASMCRAITRLPGAPDRIHLPGGVCDEGHSALDDLTPFARSKCPLLGVKRTFLAVTQCPLLTQSGHWRPGFCCDAQPLALAEEIAGALPLSCDDAVTNSCNSGTRWSFMLPNA